MFKNEIKNSKNSLSSNTGSNILNEIITFQRELSINKNNITPKNKSISSNHIFIPIEEDKKSKRSNSKTSKKGKEKNDLYKIKKKSKDKITNLLKNKEKMKIPIGKKRRSFANAGNNLQLHFNSYNNLSKSFTPPKKTNIRTDKNGIKINKKNKKLVHITFLDDISPDNKITETINIQSFKKYNVVKYMPWEDNLSNCSKCCYIY